MQEICPLSAQMLKCSNAQGLERTVFGSTVQADDLTSQVTDAFLRGWGIVGPSENPSLEDFNAAFYTVSQLIAYQHQMGVPEWEVKQEYYIGSVCSYKGELYVSLSNSNTGSGPPSAQWTPVITAKNGVSKLGLGSAAKRDVGTGTNQIPDMNSFASTNAVNGQLILPNGLIWKWGEISTSAATQVITFPAAFPNICIFGSPTHIIESLSSYTFAQAVSRSANGIAFGLYTVNSGAAPSANTVTVTLDWQALGF